IPQLSLIYVGTEYLTEEAHQLVEMFKHYSIEMNTHKPESAKLIKDKLGYKFSDKIIEQSIRPINTLTGEKSKEELLRYFRAIMEVSPEAIGGRIPDEAFFIE
ncbi:MAG: hypothetical protein JXR56_03520, partial [Candidatus Cloacimonetes bacterium]|nr:hypothetical protein [Candidatus Cloacimonadota bacterium]